MTCGGWTDRIIADFHPALGMRRDLRAQLPGEHLGTQTDAEKRPLLP